MRDALEMAKEAGAIHIHKKPKEFAIVGNETIKVFEALVRSDEQESIIDLVAMYGGPVDLEAAIRARGNT